MGMCIWLFEYSVMGRKDKGRVRGLVLVWIVDVPVFARRYVDGSVMCLYMT